MSDRGTALVADGDSLAPYVLASLLFHAGAASWLVLLTHLASMWKPDMPIIDPKDIIEISMVSLPAARFAPVARDAIRAQSTPPPPTPPSPENAPPPPDPNMPALAPIPPAPTAPPDPNSKAQPPSKEDDKRRKELLQELEMDRLLDELADEGSRPQDAAGPSVDIRSTASRLIGPGTGDPEAARYIAQLQKLFLENFRPLPTLRGQGLSVVVFVTVDDTGRVQTRRVEKPSGNTSFDQAALAAVDYVSVVPPPPPSLRDGSADTYRIPFSD